MFPAHAQISPGPATHVIVAADPTKPLTPAPLISDILRTHFCIPGSVLLVEGVDAAIPASKHRRAVRLLLSDGELCIQALLQPELHPLIDSRQVYIGSYVRLHSFELRWLQSEGGVNRSNKSQSAVLLVVNEMTFAGWNAAFRDLTRLIEPHYKDQTQSVRSEVAFQEQRNLRAGILDNSVEQPAVEEPADLEDDDAFETMVVTGEQTTQRRLQSQAPRRRAQFASASLPWVSADLSKPLKLTPLASIPNLPYKQNWTVNVLAVVASLSGIEAATLPPFTQRTARLVDPSTTKQVLLTVFLEPEAFIPEIGSVVLLLGVKNHRFDGGSLKKYGNERPKEGSTWWIEDPWELPWCDVASLKKWWSDEDQK